MDAQLTTATSTYPVFPDGLPERTLREGRYEVRFARTDEELDAVLRMRFEVFNLELGEGLDESFATGRDRDEFDPVCHHLMVVEWETGAVVGTYRLQTSEMAARHLGFYSASEFDFAAMPPAVVAEAVEIGRACISAAHRNTQVLFLLWKGLALYVAANRRRYLFGCCSLTSQDPVEGRAALAQLAAAGHLHPEVRLTARPGFECAEAAEGDGPLPEIRLPMLFRIYLRHGGRVCGPPAIDPRFKTIDFLMLFDVNAMNPRMFQTYFG
jgi:putative hemolysin